MGQERCEAKMDEQVDGMTRKMKDQIQCRRKLHPGQTDAEKWEQIYKILFPNEAVPDPCRSFLSFFPMISYIPCIALNTHTLQILNQC